MLAVVEQDVKGHVSAQHVLDGGLHHRVEVSGGVRLVQHVADLQAQTGSVWGRGRPGAAAPALLYLVLTPQQLQRIQLDL